MNKKLIGVIVIVIIGLGFGAYKLYNSSLFDTNGQYIKNVAKQSDKNYIASCELVPYDELLRDSENYLGKDIKYYGVIVSIKDIPGKNIEYILNIPSQASDDKRKAKIVIEKDIEFYTGDKVDIYGKFESLIEDGEDTIPCINAKVMKLKK